MSMRNSIDELAKNVNLPNKSTKKVVEYLKHDILLSLYRKNPVVEGNEEKTQFNLDMNKKVEDLYQSRYGKKFDSKVHAKNKQLALFLMGPPGQGKTASYIVAAKETCADLGLTFIEHVNDDYVPKRNHFVMVVQECAGENSAITFGGVPRAEEVEINGKKMHVLKKAVNFRFTVFDECAGGVLLFDDAANAAQVIQNVLLPVAQFGSFQGMKISNACIGFTGNLGALDGTYTNDLSSALRTRVIPMFVTDNVQDFANRAYEQYNDSLGDLGIINFLLRNKQDFAVLPDPNEKSGFACSRSWDNLIQSIRSVVERNGGRGRGEQESLEEIHSLAMSTVGPTIGQKLAGYYNSLIRGADPLARQFVLDGKPNMDELKNKYKGGASAGDISFGYQFATACGDYAVNMIAEAKDPNKEIENASKRFGNAVLQLNDSEFCFALEHFKSKLSAYVTDFSQPTNKGRELKGEVRKTIAKAINELPDCDIDKREMLLKVITDFDKLQSAVVSNKKRAAMS